MRFFAAKGLSRKTQGGHDHGGWRSKLFDCLNGDTWAQPNHLLIDSRSFASCALNTFQIIITGTYFYFKSITKKRLTAAPFTHSLPSQYH